MHYILQKSEPSIPDNIIRIGCGVANELARKGYRTLNVDKLSDAGSGPTSNCCGCIRFFYSTYNGVALAYEGYHYWKNWAEYLGVEDERGYANYREICGYLPELDAQIEDFNRRIANT